MKTEFEWIDFYIELANKLLSFKSKRGELLSKTLEILERTGMRDYFKDADGQKLTDVAPFTVMGIFNRGINKDNRIATLREFAEFFNISAPVPKSFEGIPLLNNMNAWFFGGKDYDRAAHIDKLWELFEVSISLADNPNEDAKNRFTQVFDFVETQPYSSWNITFGLFWIRPYRYIALDKNTRNYINKNFGMNINDNEVPDGNRYLEICFEIKNKLSESDEIDSFPALSKAAKMTQSLQNDVSTVTTLKEILPVPSSTNTLQYWAYSPGPNASLWDEFYSLSIIGIGWDEIDDLKHYQNREQITNILAKQYPEEKSSFKNDSLALWDFASKMQIGDIVYAKSGRTMLIGRGIITSGYIYDDSRAEYKHIRKINWTHSGKWTLDSPIAMKTLTDLTSYRKWCIKTEELICGRPVVNGTKYDKDNFLNEVYMTPEKYDDITALLDRKKNIILQGAPGVGKSFLARRLAYSVIGIEDANKVEMVQFHQSYSYEDFIEGFRPVGGGNFDIKEGVFYKFCQKAMNDKAHKYFFIIDEINRGNLSKIMGELMLLLESDKRGEEFAMPLTYSGDRFYVPENVYVIGMMNTADRSLAMIDYALRRRFSFIPIEPAFDNKRFIADFRKNYSDADTVIEKMKSLNELIVSELDSGHQIGHSYFCFNKPVDKKVISGVFRFEIEELLREYFFDNEEILKKAQDLL